MIQPAIRQPRFISETTLGELLANVLRDTGWIMAGGSAQFRSGALSELQASLGQLHQHTASQRVASAAKVLGEKAVLVASRNVNDAEAILSLHRVLAEFEQATKACIASSK